MQWKGEMKCHIKFPNVINNKNNKQNNKTFFQWCKVIIFFYIYIKQQCCIMSYFVKYLCILKSCPLSHMKYSINSCWGFFKHFVTHIEQQQNYSNHIMYALGKFCDNQTPSSPSFTFTGKMQLKYILSWIALYLFLWQIQI